MKQTLDLPVQLLWQYREFNRITKPRPQLPFWNSISVTELMRIRAKKPLLEPIELAIYNGRALVNDGNHRLAVSKLRGETTISVTVTFHDEASADNTFYHFSLNRFKKINQTLSRLLTPIAG